MKDLQRYILKAIQDKTVNGYLNRNCNRQNSVGITSKLLARNKLPGYRASNFEVIPTEFCLLQFLFR